MSPRPLLSIVTPCYNSERYIEDCLLSVVRQSYENVEHIIVDGGSTDATLDILKTYEDRYNMRWISEGDKGMYDAIAKGFALARGEIFAWLNSDDMYSPWACALVAAVMENRDVAWCTGLPCHYTAGGIAHNIPRVAPIYPRSFIRRGYMDGRASGFLQQESMFWRRSLWEAHGHVIRPYRSAGDYHLWKAFASTAPLYTLDSLLSGFRIHPGQKSQDREAYEREMGALTWGRKLLAHTGLVSTACLLYSLLSRKYRIRCKEILIAWEKDEK